MDKLTELMKRYPQLEGCKEDIEKAMELLRNMYNGGGKLLACGNGGSCADCEHIVGELMKGFLKKRGNGEKTRKTQKNLRFSVCIFFVHTMWWRRWESNPRPKTP